MLSHTPEPVLIASYWTLAGNSYPGASDECSPHPLPARLEAAAAAGYRGVGLLHSDLMAHAGRYGMAGVAAMIRDAGLDLVELEVLNGWHCHDDRRQVSEQKLRDFAELATHVEVRHVKVGGTLRSEHAELGDLVTGFRRICQHAADAGMQITLEYAPFSNIADPWQAQTIVAEAGEDNGGVLADIWHTARAGIPYSVLAELPAGTINHVEIDDADTNVVGSLFDDTIFRRRLCGQGDLDVPAFLREIWAHGYQSPLGVEVISREMASLPVADAARLSHDTAVAQIRAAASSPETGPCSSNAAPIRHPEA